jgi:hypothetical protein
MAFVLHHSNVNSGKMDKKNNNTASDKTGEEIPAQQQPPEKQLIKEKGEEYLRESGNIEDLPEEDDND